MPPRSHWTRCPNSKTVCIGDPAPAIMALPEATRDTRGELYADDLGRESGRGDERYRYFHLRLRRTLTENK